MDFLKMGSSPINVGDVLPDVEVVVGPSKQSLRSLLYDKKGVIFGVPGAFTPVCTQKHLPGFKDKMGELRSRGVEFVGCMAVNDPFVMKAWFQQLDAPKDMEMICDGNGELTKAMRMDADMSENNLGTRCKRFAMVVGPAAKVLWIGMDDNSFVESVLNNL